MKLRLTSAVLLSALALAAVACSSTDVTGTGTDDLKNHKGPVCDPIVCPADQHWSSTACACIATCTEMWLCVQGEKWDPDLCKCVPSITSK